MFCSCLPELSFHQRSNHPKDLCLSSSISLLPACTIAYLTVPTRIFGNTVLVISVFRCQNCKIINLKEMIISGTKHDTIDIGNVLFFFHSYVEYYIQMFNKLHTLLDWSDHKTVRVTSWGWTFPVKLLIWLQYETVDISTNQLFLNQVMWKFIHAIKRK